MNGYVIWKAMPFIQWRQFYLFPYSITKRLEKNIDGNYTRMLRAILNKSWRQYPTKHQLYGHLPPITKTIQVRRTRHAGCTPRDLLIWPEKKQDGQLKHTYIHTYMQQLCEDMGCSPEDLPEAMNHREEWWERVRDIHAGGTTWW